MSELRGKVVLIDFWTYTCINCIRTLPYLEAWQQRYGRDGFTVVGVHSPEFPFEKDADNVQAAIRQNHLTYPVVQDNDLATWDAWGNQYWPADYLVDAQGQRPRRPLRGGGLRRDRAGDPHPAAGRGPHESRVRGARVGAGALRRRDHAGDLPWGSPRPGVGQRHHPSRQPGLRRASGRRCRSTTSPTPGHWGITDEDATSGAGCPDRPGVQRPPGLPRTRLTRPRARTSRSSSTASRSRPSSPERMSGSGQATIESQRLYRLVDLPAVARHRLSLTFDPGISGYAFTFG